MIRIVRIPLDDKLAGQLARRTAQLKNADTAGARRAWQSARAEKAGLRSHLNEMAPGVQRCMYCADSLGTDIDHFEPIKELPARTFDWPNHLLACSFCNSNQKRDLFPRDAAGLALLIDPTTDDPVDHLRLILRTGEYRPLTLRGTATIDVFGLNRRDLTRGRSGAFEMAKAALCRAHDLLRSTRDGEAADCVRALREQPHASVLNEMLRAAELPGAVEVLGADTATALRDQAVKTTLVQVSQLARRPPMVEAS
jgi:uncharacterized protein (TIGR02646 family)